MQTHQITKHLLAAFAYFASGFTVKEILSFTFRKLRMWRDRRIDNRIVAYLLNERRLNPPVGPDGGGHYSRPYYRNSIDISKGIKRGAVDVRMRLERLEIEKRVERAGPGSDSWTLTEYEMHDSGPHGPMSRGHQQLR